ncbi:MAG: hypothetical protein V3V95_07950 [Thermodesulfobacteriota bacterium]
MTFVVLAISFIMAMSWYVSDKSQVNLKDEIVIRKGTEQMLARELGTAQAKSAESTLMFTELELQRSEEQVDFEKKLEAKDKEKELTLTTSQMLEQRLIGAEARLKADQPIFENDNLIRKVKGARASLANARRLPTSTESSAKRLDTRIRNVEKTLREAERVLEDAKDNRLATELLISQEKTMTIASLGGEANWAQQILAKERTDSRLSLENFQQEIRSTNQRELKRQVLDLEERFISFKDSKKSIEGRWSNAMTALIKMDETAKRIEDGLMASLEQGAEYEAGGGDPIEGLVKLRSEMESLKLARQNMHTVMGDIKVTIDRSVESESELMMAETSDVLDTLNRLMIEAKFHGMEAPPEEYAGLIESLSVGIDSDDPEILDKKLEELNLLTNYLVRAGGKKSTRDGMLRPPTEFDEYLTNKLDFDIYIVQQGDTLWDIASDKKIYGDPYMWPMLYKYNVARVDDPNIIEPQLKLVVKKQPQNVEVEDTLERARTSTLGEYRLYNEEWLKELCRP